MKKLNWKWAVLIVAVALVVGLVAVYFRLNRIIQNQVEVRTTEALNVNTTLGGANLSLFGGTLSLDDLAIDSPEGFEAPQMFSLGQANVAVSFGELRDDPMRISEITLRRPTLVIEHQSLKTNVQALMENIRTDEDAPTDGTRDEGEPIHMVIGQLEVADPKVILRPGLPGLEQEIVLDVPSLTLNDIGTGEGNQNGAALQDVIMQVIAALTAEAANSEQVPPEVRKLLSLNLNSIAQMAGEELQSQLEQVREDVKAQVGEEIQKVFEGQSPEGREAGKAIEETIGGLLDLGKKGDRPAQPEQE